MSERPCTAWTAVLHAWLLLHPHYRGRSAPNILERVTEPPCLIPLHPGMLGAPSPPTSSHRTSPRPPSPPGTQTSSPASPWCFTGPEQTASGNAWIHRYLLGKLDPPPAVLQRFVVKRCLNSEARKVPHSAVPLPSRFSSFPNVHVPMSSHASPIIMHAPRPPPET